MEAGDASGRTGMTPDELAYRRVLSDQLARYAALGVPDLYKLAFQGVMGSEHAVTDVAVARLHLQREVEALSESVGEPVAERLVEPLTADRAIVRVNLRPYLASGRDLEDLLAAFVQTGHRHRGTTVQLWRLLRTIERWIPDAGAPAARLSVPGWQAHVAAMADAGFPPCRHSPAYRVTHWPAYRVVLRRLLANRGNGDDAGCAFPNVDR